MKALVIKEYGSPNKLSIEEVPKPIIMSNEVLVKIKAVSINDLDLGIIEGKSLINRLLAGLFRPKIQILGSDIAGVIEEIGESVTKFKIGDKVYGDLSDNKFGGFAEYVATSEKNLCHIAEGMPFDIAAAIPQAGQLAYQALYDFSEITEGQKILINGAGGGVGTFAVQMLRKHKVHLTGVDTDVKREMLLKLGYDEFIDYMKTDFTEQNTQYDIVIDCKTNKSPRKYKKILKENGMYITIGGDIPKVIWIMFMSKYLEKRYRRAFKCVILHTNRNLPEINKMFEEGNLTSIIDPRSFTLETGREAMEYYATGEQLGKVLIVVDE
ncbi:MAG: Zn-dependent oxidoreductase [Fusobacteria bacterium]|nr:MAG: Zn-dependent oxidoreductase [Fusobacteriota bacterium]KAF0228656.1 MAG: Zn-dependent [Fusobacteriota bacterium]